MLKSLLSVTSSLLLRALDHQQAPTAASENVNLDEIIENNDSQKSENPFDLIEEEYYDQIINPAYISQPD